jgi:hypothetical protein
MTFSGEDREPSFHDVREYLLGTLNEALRRPGMFGGELSLRIYLDAVAFTYGNPNFMRTGDTFARIPRTVLAHGSARCLQPAVEYVRR